VRGWRDFIPGEWWSARQRSQDGDETVAPAWNGFDEARSLSIIPEGDPYAADGVFQNRIAYEAVSPHLIERYMLFPNEKSMFVLPFPGAAGAVVQPPLAPPPPTEASSLKQASGRRHWRSHRSASR
jgi:hypothetical protein